MEERVLKEKGHTSEDLGAEFVPLQRCMSSCVQVGCYVIVL